MPTPLLAKVARRCNLTGFHEGYVRRSGFIKGRHLIPSFMSYLIIYITLAIPGLILGETALSFLGIGMRAPAGSLCRVRYASPPS